MKTTSTFIHLPNIPYSLDFSPHNCSLVSLAHRVESPNPSLLIRPQSVLLMFSLCILVSGLISMPFVHYELILLYSVKGWSSFTSVRVALQFFFFLLDSFDPFALRTNLNRLEPVRTIENWGKCWGPNLISQDMKEKVINFSVGINRTC